MIHCCVCINTMDPNKAREATQVANTYLLCDEHAELAYDEFARVIRLGESHDGAS